MLTPAVYSLLLLCGFEQPKDDYVYLSLLRTSSRMYVMEGISAEVREGYLNRYGVFISESKALITSTDPKAQSFFWRDVYNTSWFNNELVYEYRSGMLVPGRLGGNGQLAS
ncbi:MAG: hypothetical protein QM703_23730 [Gemmatales bacterium]